MQSGDDRSELLPDPPPVRPARRDETIAAALRTFDGIEAQASGARRTRERRGWGRQPQYGLLVSAALIAVIGVPTTLIAIRDRPAEQASPAAEPPSADRPAPGEVAFDAAQSPPPAVAEAAEPAQVVAPKAVVTARNAPVATAPMTQRAEKAADAATAARTGSTEASAVAPAASMAPPAIVAPPAPSPPPPPPPPAPAAPSAQRYSPPAMTSEKAVADSSADNIMVTGARRTSALRPEAKSGWTVCTVDDPRRSVTGCGAQIADGLAHARQGDFDRALRSFDDAVRARPRSGAAYLNRGLVQARRGDLRAALSDLDRAVRYEGSARAYYQRSLILRRMGATARAEADEARANALDPQ